jgi:adenosylcobinamide kinase / adenosylcobinamide-phosphate guanylyltransferase
MPDKILYIGGVKSGKSRLAEHRAISLAAEMDPDQRPFYLATTDPADRSMEARIQRHRQERGDTFITLEEPRDLVKALKTIAQTYHLPAGEGVILIDCLTLWLSNCLLQTLAPDLVPELAPSVAPSIEPKVDRESDREANLETELGPSDPISSLETYLTQTIAGLLDAPHRLIFVINDVGSGIHADTELGRRFTDLSGLLAQQVAAGCNEVYHCIAGIGTRIK